MATAFEVIAEPTRRRILDLLRDRPRSVNELTEHLGLTQPGTSKHLRVLRDAGLVRVRPDAQRRWYELCPEPLAELDAWLAPYRWMWSGRLDALEQHLNTVPARSDTSGDERHVASQPPPVRADRTAAGQPAPTSAERPDPRQIDHPRTEEMS